MKPLNEMKPTQMTEISNFTIISEVFHGGKDEQRDSAMLQHFAVSLNILFT